MSQFTLTNYETLSCTPRLDVVVCVEGYDLEMFLSVYDDINCAPKDKKKGDRALKDQ